MIMFSNIHRQGEADELVFVARKHIVSVMTNQADKEGGSLVTLTTGQVLEVAEDRDEIVSELELVDP